MLFFGAVYLSKGRCQICRTLVIAAAVDRETSQIVAGSAAAGSGHSEAM